MSSTAAGVIALCAVDAIVIIFIVDAWRGSLNIKSRTVKNGQYAAHVGRHNRRLMKPTKSFPFEPKKWRTGKSTRNEMRQNCS